MQETASKKKTGIVANFNIKLTQTSYGTSPWRNISQRLSIVIPNQVIHVIREFNKTENHRDNWLWICFMNFCYNSNYRGIITNDKYVHQLISPFWVEPVYNFAII